ncbi:LOW QUALITY PROTEIN: uncharacterized protein V5649_007245 [Rhynchonycteris naso]
MEEKAGNAYHPRLWKPIAKAEPRLRPGTELESRERVSSGECPSEENDTAWPKPNGTTKAVPAETCAHAQPAYAQPLVPDRPLAPPRADPGKHVSEDPPLPRASGAAAGAGWVGAGLAWDRARARARGRGQGGGAAELGGWACRTEAAAAAATGSESGAERRCGTRAPGRGKRRGNDERNKRAESGRGCARPRRLVAEAARSGSRRRFLRKGGGALGSPEVAPFVCLPRPLCPSFPSLLRPSPLPFSLTLPPGPSGGLPPLFCLGGWDGGRREERFPGLGPSVLARLRQLRFRPLRSYWLRVCACFVARAGPCRPAPPSPSPPTASAVFVAGPKDAGGSDWLRRAPPGFFASAAAITELPVVVLHAVKKPEEDLTCGGTVDKASTWKAEVDFSPHCNH